MMTHCSADVSVVEIFKGPAKTGSQSAGCWYVSR